MSVKRRLYVLKGKKIDTMKKILLLMAIFFSVLLQAQLNTLSMNLPQGHPRYLTDAGGKETTLKLISNEPWAEEVFGKLKSKTDVYVLSLIHI